MAGSSDKIFVGGLPKNCSLEMFSAYFEQFGGITDVVVMKNPETGEPRGFGFVTYESADIVDQVVAQAADHKIHDKWVDVKRATPKGDSPAPGSKGKGSSNGKQYGGGGKGYMDPSGYGAYMDFAMGKGYGGGAYVGGGYGGCPFGAYVEPFGGYGGCKGGGGYGGFKGGGYGGYKGGGGGKGYSPY